MICRFCGKNGEGIHFDQWVKPTFTDFDKLLPGEIVCKDCLFWFEEASAELQTRMGKDKPQRMRNYSHFLLNGEWVPLSKGHKEKMKDLLLGTPFPEMAVIADSGQRHLVFRAPRNAPGQKTGWVQFEDRRVFVDPQEMSRYLAVIENLYACFGKEEIETGDYVGYRILKFGIENWNRLEGQVKEWRGSALFYLALFLAQRSDDGGDQECRSGAAGSSLEGNTGGLQEPLPDDDLDAVRKPGEECGIHQQSGKIYQPALFET